MSKKERAELWQCLLQPGVPNSCVPLTVLSSVHPIHQATSLIHLGKSGTETLTLAVEWALNLSKNKSIKEK